MLTKPVNVRATTTTCAGCVWCVLGKDTHFSRCGSIPALKDVRRPSILQLNTDGLTARKISIGIFARLIGVVFALLHVAVTRIMCHVRTKSARPSIDRPIVIGKLEWQVHKGSHCGSKQQYRSHRASH